MNYKVERVDLLIEDQERLVGSAGCALGVRSTGKKFAGMDVLVDPSMEPDTVELRMYPAQLAFMNNPQRFTLCAQARGVGRSFTAEQLCRALLVDAGTTRRVFKARVDAERAKVDTEQFDRELMGRFDP